MRHLIWITVVSFGLTRLVSGQTTGAGEVELALDAIGKGTVDEMKGRLITSSITVFNDAYRARAVAALPAPILTRRITQGWLFRRAEEILKRTLQLHGRGGKVELFLFKDDAPSAMLWRGCAVAVSDGLADTLDDGELAGVFAHELGHSYFEDEMAAALQARDALALRVVELKCDAVAMLSLKLLGYDPAHFLKALQRIQLIKSRKNLSISVVQSHPDLRARAMFSQRFIQSLG